IQAKLLSLDFFELDQSLQKIELWRRLNIQDKDLLAEYLKTVVPNATTTDKEEIDTKDLDAFLLPSVPVTKDNIPKSTAITNPPSISSSASIAKPQNTPKVKSNPVSQTRRVTAGKDAHQSSALVTSLRSTSETPPSKMSKARAADDDELDFLLGSTTPSKQAVGKSSSDIPTSATRANAPTLLKGKSESAEDEDLAFLDELLGADSKKK
ncbi:hypothetical protein HDV05_007034, partial [Chytridiales sp. JEL 0842]